MQRIDGLEGLRGRLFYGVPMQLTSQPLHPTQLVIRGPAPPVACSVPR